MNYDDVKLGMSVTTPQGAGTVKKKHNPQVQVGGAWWFAGQISPVVLVTTYTRSDLVRAILGQQWAVAIALHRSLGWCHYVGDLPCAVDVVEGMDQAG